MLAIVATIRIEAIYLPDIYIGSSNGMVSLGRLPTKAEHSRQHDLKDYDRGHFFFLLLALLLAV